jgi:hypothetical protein
MKTNGYKSTKAPAFVLRAERALRRAAHNVKTQNRAMISKEEKSSLSYDFASREYRKKGTLVSQGPRSPSLAIFLNELNRRAIQLPAVE